MKPPSTEERARAEAEYARLYGWRERWTNLANDRERARKRGGLQSQQDYIEARARLADCAIAALLRDYHSSGHLVPENK